MVSISTRAHGAIDYFVSALLWGLARTGRFSPAVRRLLGAAPPAYVAYSALTDYEWGAVPVLSVPSQNQSPGLQKLPAWETPPVEW